MYREKYSLIIHIHKARRLFRMKKSTSHIDSIRIYLRAFVRIRHTVKCKPVYALDNNTYLYNQ